jgi:mannose/fructose/N-acetylgalactosamine-specific phosphotransferase system component IID
MPEVRVKRSMPSLIGGIFTAVVVFALWLLLFGAGSIPMILLGFVIAGVLGTWIRLADL